MDWSSANKQDNLIDIPKRWLHLHYYEALNILFRTENSLRVFVYTTLKNHLFEKWMEAKIPVSDTEHATIDNLAKKRITQAQGFGYLGYQITSPLMHLNSGELVRLITSDAYWDIFKKYFRGKREIIRNKLDEIGVIRNSLAHFRPIKNDDIELIKQNTKHALIGVEECLSEMTKTYNVVPTNTADEWYVSLKCLDTGLCDIMIYQSDNEEWIRIQLTFNSKILKKEGWWKGYYSCSVTNLITPAVIELYVNIRHFVTYVTEYVPYAPVGDDAKPEFSKNVSFIFRKSVLSDNVTKIVTDLKNVFTKIIDEVALVEQDNLARGQLIATERTSIEYVEREQYKGWVSNIDNLICPFKENHPAEYWGDVGLYHRDFVAGITKYPWMPSSIAERE